MGWNDRMDFVTGEEVEGYLDAIVVKALSERESPPGRGRACGDARNAGARPHSPARSESPFTCSDVDESGGLDA
jgi:hypothetical protein